MNICEIIKELRSDGGHSYASLASKVGKTEVSVRRWEKGSVRCGVAETQVFERMLKTQKREV